MKVYIPFNMIIDTDYGAIRLVEETQKVSPYSKNKLKSFLLNREDEDPIKEYSTMRRFDIAESTYDIIMRKYYKSVLPLSISTDLLAFVINTSKLGLTNEMLITIGYDFDCEKEYLKKILSKSKIPIHVYIEKNSDIELKEFEYIFIRYIDQDYTDYLINTAGLSQKRLYVADYNFNTLYDTVSNSRIIDPMIHMRLESEGNVLCTVSLYNKK